MSAANPCTNQPRGEVPMQDKTQDLIREMQENVARYGKENTTTFLMVQAIKVLQQQARALEAVGAGGVQPLTALDDTYLLRECLVLLGPLSDLIAGNGSLMEVMVQKLRTRLAGKAERGAA